MSEQPPLLAWPGGKGRKGSRCGRNPNAGPGSSWWWWEGCPKAEQRGCYRAWLKAMGDPRMEGIDV